MQVGIEYFEERAEAVIHMKAKSQKDVATLSNLRNKLQRSKLGYEVIEGESVAGPDQCLGISIRIKTRCC